ncbi:TetR/AcrR family transcriptional regulator [Glutamicibacter bergerei]|uniref:TetR family transcriptional regulator n=2 Tax=Glutamicibacter TaxID=1742989 RepID=A0A365YED3_9MICC|nr:MULTISPECIES: TetR/AcrR family transcriptional regulator [Glutamicibacter]RBM01056.1 TetR family transcriptional regulator [Glutamicibacter soli]HAY42536.1 TetR family transcriptional regulator [Micrococcaceae bacterium]
MAIRSEGSRRAILEATMKLLDNSGSAGVSVQKLSIERIAREAGVSKTTIYRWWPSKVAVVIDTFLDNHVARTPVREDIPAIDALREHLKSLTEVYAGGEGRLVAQLVGECQQDHAALTEFKDRFWNPRAAAVSALIERVMDEGAMRSDLDPMMVTEMLYAPVYFRLLVESGPLDAAAVNEILETALEGLAVRK